MDSKQMKTVIRPALDPERDCLDSWKEIAVYLGREVRTAQRWEKREGLPVHRHIHTKASSVWAFKHEIDAWLQSRIRASREPAPNGKHAERAAESLNPTLLTAAPTPVKARLSLQNATVGVGSLDLLQGDGRIRLYFYVQFRAERNTNASLTNSVARDRGVN
jgi:predicted DNA-binding transcriptional regulator AlpA